MEQFPLSGDNYLTLKKEEEIKLKESEIKQENFITFLFPLLFHRGKNNLGRTKSLILGFVTKSYRNKRQYQVFFSPEICTLFLKILLEGTRARMMMHCRWYDYITDYTGIITKVSTNVLYVDC